MIETPLNLAKIESTLICFLHPTFLAITLEPSPMNELVYHIIISHPNFKFMTIPERINKVYELLSTHNPDLLKESPIVVEAYDDQEMEDLIEDTLE